LKELTGFLIEKNIVMQKDILVITWPISDKDDWLPCPESFLTKALTRQFGEFIEQRKYLSVNLNLIMLSENTNCGMFLDTKIGDWVGLGIFFEADLRKIPLVAKKHIDNQR